MRVHRHLVDAGGRPVARKSACPRKQRGGGGEGGKRGEVTERTSPGAEEPLSDINTACAIAVASTAEEASLRGIWVEG